jgi:acetyltransferase-like isoleucine patch superfamily enzyme
MKATSIFLSFVGRGLGLLIKIKRRMLMYLYRPLFAAHGRNFWFDPHGEYTYSNIYVGDDVSLGTRPRLSSTRSTIVIGNKVMFGPEVAIHGGNHTTIYHGRYMVDVREDEKRPEDDRDVVIEDDVWIGTRAIILHGVNIGRGSIVGAGAIVTKSVPPYSIVAGNPAEVIRFRWDVETIMSHEETLYPVEKRYIRKDIECWQKDATMLPPLRRKT